MLDLMTWSEIVDSLRTEGNLKMAVIFDLEGEKLAASSGITISKPEACGLLKSLSTPCSAVFALFLGGTRFSCLRVDEVTLIGRAGDEIFVAHRSDNVLICGYSDVGAPSSCLGCVRSFALKLKMQAVPDVVAAPSLI